MPDPLTVTAALTLAGKCVSKTVSLVQQGHELETAYNTLADGSSVAVM
mgnify:CR=1 FL=1